MYDLKYLKNVYPLEFSGYRDVIWCPYSNEPTFLKWHGDEAYCDQCNGNYEPETHKFIKHITRED